MMNRGVSSSSLRVGQSTYLAGSTKNNCENPDITPPKMINGRPQKLIVNKKLLQLNTEKTTH